MDGALAELEQRQEAILARLGRLRAEVERLGGGAAPGGVASAVAATLQSAGPIGDAETLVTGAKQRNRVLF